MVKCMKRAIVLSGGGAKGAYQIGVWKALRKLKIDYSIVTGTSVGALNGAFMVQKDYYKAVNMWYHMSFSHVFEHMDGNYQTLEGKKNILLTYAKGIMNGGMNISRLEKTLDKYLNVKRFYQSPIDFGLITVNVSDLKPESICKKDIKPNELKDYLLASASCFPAFPVKEIHGKKFVDGGYYDNIPIRLAIELGAEEIIAVDLKSFGFKHPIKEKNIPITYIKPYSDLGSFLVFDQSLARRAMRLGFLDTMKKYGKLDGKVYAFQKGELNVFYKKMNSFLEQLEDKYKKYINKQKDEKIIELIDFLGKCYSISDDKVYTYKSFHKALKKKFQKTKSIHLDEIRKQLRHDEPEKMNHMGMVLKYFCNEDSHREEFCKLFQFVPITMIAALYLEYTLNQHSNFWW